MKYTGDGKFIQVSVCQKYQHRMWFDRVNEKIKRGLFFLASQGILKISLEKLCLLVAVSWPDASYLGCTVSKRM